MNTETTSTVATDVIAVAAEHLSTLEPVQAVNAVARAHFGGSVSRMITSVLRSLDPVDRNAILFRRKWNSDGTRCDYNLAGMTGYTEKGPDGKWRHSGFIAHARDASGNLFTRHRGQSGTGYDTESRAHDNAAAAWRNLITWIMEEAETTREAKSNPDAARLAAEADALRAKTEALVAEV